MLIFAVDIRNGVYEGWLQ